MAAFWQLFRIFLVFLPDLLRWIAGAPKRRIERLYNAEKRQSMRKPSTSAELRVFFNRLRKK
jgi:hypothetical protein